MSRIAVIGTGISGMAAARLLHRHHEITVFEAASHPGGHTNTVDVTLRGPQGPQVFPVDTGFIVFNHRTYPAFTTMLKTLGVESIASDMSFSVRDDTIDLEYLGGHLKGLFAQPRNVLRPAFWRMIREIVRFYREARELLASEGAGEQPLGPWLRQRGYSQFFIDEHLIPMAASIWSAPPKAIINFPAHFFVRFLANHGMIDLSDRPQWRTVCGGSRAYLEALIAPFRQRIHCNCPIHAVRRVSAGIRIQGPQVDENFEQVVIAAHADQALAMRVDASPAERDILSQFPYQPNEAVLHTDTSFLPKRRAAWAAWNYQRSGQHGQHHRSARGDAPVTLTYNLNILQRHQASEQFLVTLNPQRPIAPQRMIRRIAYAHPLFSARSPAAQVRHGEISGRDGIHYCGAYWGYGFHEDGLQSALRVGRAFGIEALA